MRNQPSPATSTAEILRWVALPDPDAVLPALDRAFFQSSATQTFSNDAARAAFRWRWLGRYLEQDPSLVHVAVSAGGEAVGYVVGSLDDPARSARFDDIGYFRTIPHLTARYPAQLHVNLVPEHRGRRLGAALVDAFSADARSAGAPGVHVVTARGMRNVGFYLRNSFEEVGAFDWNGRELVFLGRRLAA